MKKMSKLIAAASVAALSTAASAAVTIQSYNSYGETFDPGFVTNVGGAGPIGGGPAVEFDILTTAGKSFAAFCLEVDAHFGGAGNSYNPSTTAPVPLTAQTKDAIARLFAVSGFNGSKFAIDGVNTLAKATGLQLAIWEVVSDGLTSGYSAYDKNLLSTASDGGGNWLDFNSPTAGLFKATSFSFSAVSQATSYLNAAAALSIGSYTTSTVVFLNNTNDPHRQNLVTSVPEPSTYALMAACLGVMGLVARRKQQA